MSGFLKQQRINVAQIWYGAEPMSALRPMSGALAWLTLACPLPLTRYVQRRLYLRLVLRRSPRKLRLCRHLLGP